MIADVYLMKTWIYIWGIGIGLRDSKASCIVRGITKPNLPDTKAVLSLQISNPIRHVAQDEKPGILVHFHFPYR